MKLYFNKVLIFSLLILSFVALPAQGVRINPDRLSSWSSQWISSPDALSRDYGVYHFRKIISLTSKPNEFIVHISADNRYRLLVNGKSVCTGPARGDLHNWYFESVDLASFLEAGDNIISAVVWNMGTLAPVAQISNQTAFVVQGDGEKEQMVNTNSSWKVFKNESYKPCSTDNGSRLRAYMVIGPGDEVNGSLYPWGWEELGFDDSDWKKASIVTSPTPVGIGSDNYWNLTPRNIPLMEETFHRMKSVRKSQGIQISDKFIQGNAPLVIEPNKKVNFIIDQGYNTTAYPYIVLNGGAKAKVKVSYAEALYDDKGNKGNRNEVEGRSLIGNYDIFISDGNSNRVFSPLWLRTYRYIGVEVETQSEALTINDIYGMYTGYPFVTKASFTANDKSMQDIWNVGWRTARLCAGETYYDCPYYEQLQYPGDTRIQALISLYITGDDRLMRKAILDFYNSRVPEGLTQGRHPSNRLQVIPPYALFWVSMIYDYWMYRQDDEFLAQFLPAIGNVLSWYENRIDTGKGMLGAMEWWNFTDYTDVFPNGVPPGADDGNSSVVTLQYVYTLRQAAHLYNYFQMRHESNRLIDLANDISSATYKLCFNEEKNQMADTPEKLTYSQHASIMAILSETIDQKDKAKVMKQVVEDSSMGPVTFYFRFYLTQALKTSGMGDNYYESLKYWRDMLAMGLTTFAEKPEPARSDCHAWSASPLHDYFAIICGITPNSEGFKTVSIAPSLGELKEVSATMPHPSGEIAVQLKRKGTTGIEAVITLPENVTGIFKWKNMQVDIQGGRQTVVLP